LKPCEELKKALGPKYKTKVADDWPWIKDCVIDFEYKGYEKLIEALYKGVMGTGLITSSCSFSGTPKSMRHSAAICDVAMEIGKGWRLSNRLEKVGCAFEDTHEHGPWEHVHFVCRDIDVKKLASIIKHEHGAD
jgi:hypothetical protein